MTALTVLQPDGTLSDLPPMPTRGVPVGVRNNSGVIVRVAVRDKYGWWASGTDQDTDWETLCAEDFCGSPVELQPAVKTEPVADREIGILRWEDPPPRFRARAIDYTEVADALRANPGRWAVVDEHVRGNTANMATQIQTGRLIAFRPAGAFEAQARQRDGQVTVYARYVGCAA